MGVTNLKRWPWTFDFADVGGAVIPAIPFTFFGRIANGPFGQKTDQNWSVGTFNWTSPTAGVNDQVIIQDIDGIEIWRSAPATGADFEDQYRTPDSVKVTGFILFQFPHGVLEVHYR
jgi:hypothetical protein